MEITFGTLNHSLEEYQEIANASELVGKTIEAVGWTSVEGAYGDEPATVLFFTDKTKSLFVHPQEDE